MKLIWVKKLRMTQIYIFEQDIKVVLNLIVVILVHTINRVSITFPPKVSIFKLLLALNHDYMNFLNRTLSFLVERSENEFAAPSNRWSGRKSKNFRSKNLQMNSN